MDERNFFVGFAKEVRNHTNQRLKSLLAWCDKLNTSLGTCMGNTEVQHVQAAITAGNLLMEVSYQEACEETLEPHLSRTLFVKEDPILLKYIYTVDRPKKITTVEAVAVDAKTEEPIANWSAEPIVLHADSLS